MKVLAVLQARTSSKRMPGKVLKPLLGRAMILRQLERIARCRTLDGVVLATSEDPSDDPLAAAMEGSGAEIFRGSLDNVLERFFRAAERSGPAHVVRLTGDCPLADPDIIDSAVELHLGLGYDYTTNALRPTFPDGLDVEVMTFAALELAFRNARLPSEIEHVTPYINRRPEEFRIGHLINGTDLSALRWTVDEPKDFEFVRAVYERLYPFRPDFAMADVLALLAREPGLADLNRGFERNEGLLKSLKADQEEQK